MHALVLDGQILRYAEFDGDAPTLSPNKGVWLPVVVAEAPSFNPATQVLDPAADAVGEGEVTRAQAARSKTLAELKAEKLAAAEAGFAARFAGGYTPSTGTLAGQTLQVRNMEDRTNWLTSQAAYTAAVAGGAGEVAGATFRSQSNENFTLTFAEGLGVLLDMAAWGQAGYQNLWALKDAITAADTVNAILAVDVTEGW
jgi:hypothetical protein